MQRRLHRWRLARLHGLRRARVDSKGEKVMAHTPGPWSACNNGKCKCKQIFGNDHPVAQVISGKWGDDYPSIKIVGSGLDAKAEAYMEQITYGEIMEETAEANARLIATAPDLLEACKTMANVISGWDGEWQRQCGSDFVDAYAMLSAAIAKAEPEATA
jgi:hypothetical protein